jgi:hypothetical protein
MDLAFTEIATMARAALQVARRRLAADDDLDAAVPQRLRPSLEQRRAATLAGIRQLTGEGVRSVALRPDSTDGADGQSRRRPYGSGAQIHSCSSRAKSSFWLARLVGVGLQGRCVIFCLLWRWRSFRST